MYPAKVTILVGLIEGNMLMCSRPWFSPWQLVVLMTLPLCRTDSTREVRMCLLRLTAIMVPEWVLVLMMNGVVHLECLVYEHRTDVDPV